MNLEQAIAENRAKNARFKRAEKHLRALRLKTFDYQDAGKEAKAERVAKRLSAVLKPLWDAQNKAITKRRLARRIYG